MPDCPTTAIPAWLAATQRRDGSWPVQTADGTVADRAAESNHAVYPAVGVWHEFLVTGDEAFGVRMWPLRPRRESSSRSACSARAARSSGGVATTAAPTPTPCWPGAPACTRGCAARSRWPTTWASSQPDWDLAAAQLGHAVACHEESFADKSRFSMDWYYPVLGGSLRGAPAPTSGWPRGWDTFVVPGLGIRCVSDEPWVTGAETCELALALDAIGDQARALDLLEQIQHLRDPSGAYWTGWQFVNQAHFPHEQSGWTAATVVLAADALSGATGGASIFADVQPGRAGPR